MFPLWKAICHLSGGVIRWTPAERFFECARTSRHTRGVSAVTYAQWQEAHEFRSVPCTRLPVASGAVNMERRGGTAGNRSRIDSMKPALLFGGDCNAFVLWPCRPLDRRSPLGLRRRFAQDGVFFRTRNKPEGSGGGKAGPRDAILHERMDDPEPPWRSGGGRSPRKTIGRSHQDKVVPHREKRRCEGPLRLRR